MARAILLTPLSTDNTRSATAPNVPHRVPVSPRRDLVLVILAALCVRLLFAALTHDTYDYDEFVILLLSRDLAHGAVAYHDFMFFHPPGVLVLFRALQPLLSHWWPAGRIFVMLVDAGTAGLVFRLGTRIWGRREGLVAGLVYAVSPLALISAVRVNQDSLFTFLGLLGLVLLIEREDARGDLVAGVCLGVAIWIKYPAAIFGPIYLIAAPRRVLTWSTSALLTLAAVFAPFLAHAHALYTDTVTFQRTRWLMAPEQRFGTTGLYWLGVNLPALPGLFRGRRPPWLVAGFLAGGVFALSSQVYYHYFVPIVPFGALLAGPVLCRFVERYRSLAISVGLSLAFAWAACVDLGGASPLYVTAARLSAIEPTVDSLDRDTPPGSAILADRDEYAYLAHRKALAHYFWNVGVLVDARELEKQVPAARAIVLSNGASSGYPSGFVDYLNHRYRATGTHATTIWLTRAR